VIIFRKAIEQKLSFSGAFAKTNLRKGAYLEPIFCKLIFAGSGRLAPVFFWPVFSCHFVHYPIVK